MQQPPNTALQTDKCGLSCLLHPQKPRKPAVAAELGCQRGMPRFHVSFSWVAIAAVLLPEFAQGGSYPFISSVADPGYLTFSGRNYDGGPHVLRYQFVTVDTGYVRRYLEKIAAHAALKPSEPLTLRVFPDVEFIAFPIKASATSATLEIRSYTGETEFRTSRCTDR